MQLLPSTEQSPETLDFTQNFALLDEKAVKTGRMVTLKYEEELFVDQNFATRVENLNPFLVHAYTGEMKLNPSSDNWINTQQTSTLSTQIIRRRVFDTRVSATTVDGGFGQDELSASTNEFVSGVERDDITLSLIHI